MKTPGASANFFMGRMADWPARHRIVGDVRGKGLMIGVEIVRDQKTKERAGDLRDAIVDRAFEKGLLLLGAGENTIRIAPPLMIDEEQADFRSADAGSMHQRSGEVGVGSGILGLALLCVLCALCVKSFSDV